MAQPQYSAVYRTEATHPKAKKAGTSLQKWLISMSLVGICLSIFATALVVLKSNNQPVKSWKVRPSVILAILSSTMSALLSFLLSNGIAIIWWRSARRGTTIEHLHQMTNRAILFQPHKWKTRLFAHRGFSTIFLGTCAILVAGFASQPIAQQSTKTKTSDIITDNVPMKVDILPQIPDGLSGISEGGPSNSASFDFSAAAVQWYLNDTIRSRSSPEYTCDGTCYGIINAPGISVDCSSTSQTVNLYDSNIAEQYVFLLAFNLAEDGDGHPYINFTSTYSASVDSPCHATIITNTCSVYAARAPYPVTIQGNSITLASRDTSQWNSSDRLYYPGDSPDAAAGTALGPLHGLMYLANTYYASYSSITWSGRSVTMPTKGIATEIFYIYSNSSDSCEWTWRDPTSSVLDAMGSALFRLAMNGNSVYGTNVPGGITFETQDFSVTRVITELVMKSNGKWLAATIVVEIIGLAVSILMVWTYWAQKRSLSLSPVETIQIMPAMVMEERDMSADEIVDRYGDQTATLLPKVG